MTSQPPHSFSPCEIKVPGRFAFEAVHLLTPVIKVGGLNSSERRRRENTCQEVGSKRHTRKKKKKSEKCILALRGISCECEGSLRYEPDIKSDGGASGGFFKEIRWRATPHRHARSWFDSAAGRCAHIRIAPTVFFPLPASKKEPNAAL